VTDPTPERETLPVIRERRMLDLLDAHYRGEFAGAARWAKAEHVTLVVENGYRISDFMAMDMWYSNGYALHGHEVKVSRSDWLAELRQPEKADAFMRYCDRWWLVVSDESIVRDDLPKGWGLMVKHGDRLAVLRNARKLRPEPLPKSLTAGLLRANRKLARVTDVADQEPACVAETTEGHR